MVGWWEGGGYSLYVHIIIRFESERIEKKYISYGVCVCLCVMVTLIELLDAKHATY